MSSSTASSSTERSLVLVKPDAVRRGLLGEVLSRFERKGLAIEALEMRTMDAALADQHYADHVSPRRPGRGEPARSTGS